MIKEVCTVTSRTMTTGKGVTGSSHGSTVVEMSGVDVAEHATDDVCPECYVYDRSKTNGSFRESVSACVGEVCMVESSAPVAKVIGSDVVSDEVIVSAGFNMCTALSSNGAMSE